MQQFDRRNSPRGADKPRQRCLRQLRQHEIRQHSWECKEHWLRFLRKLWQSDQSSMLCRKCPRNKKGCFQCLYTGENGNLTNNKANILNDEIQDKLIIRNGCGGTRAPYGTAVLLRTVAAVLYSVEKIFDVEDDDNYLLTVAKEEGYKKDYNFSEGMCACCGDCSTE